MDVNATTPASPTRARHVAGGAAAENLKRVLRPPDTVDWNADPGVARMLTFLEPKTVWHPKGQ
jgi:hypothetical protein